MNPGSVFHSERQQFIRAWRSLDFQTATVLTLCALLTILTLKFGSREVFQEYIFPGGSRLQEWGWWFLIQGVTGFLIPVLVLIFGFRQPLTRIGLGIGDWKLALTLFAAYVPLVLVGTWIISDGSAFQVQYPHHRPAANSWSVFAVYHALFLLYWIGWEYLWRGFMLFGTAHTFGVHAIFIQAVPFALLHVHKPAAELILSLVGGLVLGALVWRCRSFWVAVPIHSVQMLALDFWCSLRIRTGADGLGLDALRTAFSGM